MKKCREFMNRIPVWFAPLLIFVLGAVLRFVYLGDVPGGMHQDESFVALNSFGLFHEGRDSAGYRFPVYTSSWGDGQSALYSYLLVPLLALNGGIPTRFLTRLPQAIVSVLTIVCVYFVVKKMYGKSLALWSSLILAVCPWHIMMSRWGLDANLAPGFLLFAFFFFVYALDNKKLLPVAAFFYGLSLYCYAIVWLVLPVMLFIMTGYAAYHKKITINKWSLSAVAVLFVMALPLMLFVLINAGVLPQITLPFMTIPKTVGYRGTEVAGGVAQILANMKRAIQLFVFQNTGSPYDVLMPWGLFYDIGRVFIVIGTFMVVIKAFASLLKKRYSYECFLATQILGGGIACMFVAVSMHQINTIYIPLILCEAYGIWSVTEFIKKRRYCAGRIIATFLVGIYMVCLVGFQKDYYTEYKEVVNAYFAEGLEECVDYALNVCEETGLDTITAEKGAQWPRLLLYTETLPSEYLESVAYDIAPAPASFVSHDILIRTRINYEEISKESIYIIYFTDAELFSEDFELTKFGDWFVAVPNI